MSRKIKPADFEALAANLQDTLRINGVAEESQPSLLADLLFGFAAFLDERLGSNHHESIFALADAILSGEIASEAQDNLSGELKIHFHKGRKAALNLLAAHRSNRAHLLFDLQMALGIRTLAEINSEIDSEARFLALLDSRQGIRLFEVRGFGDTVSDTWRTVEPPTSKPGSLDELAQMLLELH